MKIHPYNNDSKRLDHGCILPSHVSFFLTNNLGFDTFASQIRQTQKTIIRRHKVPLLHRIPNLHL